MFKAVPLALAFVVLTGCAGALGQVSVKGKDAEVVRLVGVWEGQYEARDERRIGKIEFALEMGRHTGNGKVLVGADDAGEGGQPVAISAIEVTGDQIRGTVTRYVDARCECAVETVFVGRIDGNFIDGTFTATYPESARSETGRWMMSRSDG